MNEKLIEEAQKLFADGEEEKAISLLQPLVDAGNMVAKSNLGFFLSYYYKNNKFIKLKEGEKLLLEACEAGEASACHNLGTLWLGNSPALGSDKKKSGTVLFKSKRAR